MLIWMIAALLAGDAVPVRCVYESLDTATREAVIRNSAADTDKTDENIKLIASAAAACKARYGWSDEKLDFAETWTILRASNDVMMRYLQMLHADSGAAIALAPAYHPPHEPALMDSSAMSDSETGDVISYSKAFVQQHVPSLSPDAVSAAVMLLSNNVRLRGTERAFATKQ